MARPDPPQPDPTPGAGEDPLRRLQDRLDAASRAAERLLADAAAAAGDTLRSGGPPPSGWQIPQAPQDGERRGDLELLMQFVSSLRELIPPELQRRVAEALRELLLAVRALIDWYLERSESRRAAASQVQDIPIL